jgi:ATP-dependent DNA helicase PIF1
VIQVRGQQYKFKGHVVYFLRNVGKVYQQLPLLPRDLDVIILRPKNTSQSEQLSRQFRHQFRVRRQVVQQWLDFLIRRHRGYQDITIDQQALSNLPEDAEAIGDFAVDELDDEVIGDDANNEADDGADNQDVEVAAVPNTLAQDEQLETLRQQVHGRAPEGTQLPPVQSQQAHHQLEIPSIRSTPLNEFNRSQALLSLAFPTLYPEGRAEFVRPRRRPIKYAEYIEHALRWHDGRFARHPSFRFVVFNTLMRTQVHSHSTYFVKQRRQPLTRDELIEALQNAESPEAKELLYSISRFASALKGTRPYWLQRRRELEAYAYNLDCPGAFIAFSLIASFSLILLSRCLYYIQPSRLPLA